MTEQIQMYKLTSKDIEIAIQKQQGISLEMS